ncbi:MAG: AtpZ/AtpI family protein, partial [Clostridiales bacterium]|nr:AtpZ/AtpI family protein [Clostridiales bacterium]
GNEALSPEPTHGFWLVSREASGALGLAFQLGGSLILHLFLGVWGGNWLDGKLGTSPWMLIFGILLGVCSAVKVIYDLLIKKWVK